MDEKQKRLLEALSTVMGTDIKNAMQDDDVFEIIVNPDGKLWLDTHSKGRIDTNIYVNPQMSQQIIQQIAGMDKQFCNEENPMLSAEIEGCRFQGFLPRVVKQPSFIIRKHSKRVFTLDEYVLQGVMTEKQCVIIKQAIKEHKNIIAAGGTKSGKTTLLNAILQEIACFNERVVMIEDLPELKCETPNLLALKTTKNRNMRDLLEATLRATPDRIVVGEVRGKEAISLISAWSTGHSGGASTVHSNSAKETLLRLEDLIMQDSVSPRRYTIANAVDMIIYLKRLGNTRIIDEIIEVNGYDAKNQIYNIEKVG